MKWTRLVLVLATACGPAADVWRRVTDQEQPTQLRPGRLPNRLFAISQKSYWVPSGVDSTVVPVVDTVLMVEPDSAGGDTIGFSGEQGCCSGKVLLYLDTTSNSARVRVVDNWQDPESEVGGLLLEAGAWRQAIAHPDTGEWSDSGTVRHAFGVSDSSVQVSLRRGRAVEWVSYAGGRWLRMQVTREVRITGHRTIEGELSRSGTGVGYRLAGAIVEGFLVEPLSGFVDSLQARGTLHGQLLYHESTGRVDTVTGSWRVERRGAWRYYATVYPDEVIFKSSSGEDLEMDQARYLRMVDGSRRGDSAYVMRAFGLRRDALSPAARWPLDLAIRQVSTKGDLLPLVFELGIKQYRRGDRVLLEILADGYRGRSSPAPVEHALADAMVDQLASLHVERRAQVNREGLLSMFDGLLHRSAAVPRDAGERAAQAALITDDSHARDLLVLAAYQSDPRRYLPLLNRLADTRPGTYGYIARAYVAGNLVAEFYGPKPDAFQLKWTGRSFPGLSRPWRAHVIYFDHLPGGAALRRAQAGTINPKPDWLDDDGYGEPDYPAVGKAVALLLRAQGIEPATAFRQQFTGEPDTSGRFVWANYLLSMRDTSPLPWIRGVYRGAGGEVAANAFRLMELHSALVADIVTDSVSLAAIQNAVLECLTGRAALRDTTGKSERGCASVGGVGVPKMLQSDGLAPATIREWRGAFVLHSRRDFLKRPWEGVGMAVILSPVRRIENRFYIEYSFSPGSGEPCLCGNGGSFVLERRGGGWVVVRSGEWIS